MALIKYGATVAQASGKIAGNVFARNRHGSYIRSWTKPINPTTDAQAAARARFSDASSHWAARSKTQVLAWNSYATNFTEINGVGEDYQPSARQVFMKANNNLALVGSEMISTPPDSAVAPPALDAALVEVALNLGVITTITWTGGDPDGGCTAVVEATPPMPTGKQNGNNEFRVIGTATTELDDVDVSKYIAVFGDTAHLQSTILFRVSQVDTLTGLRSGYTQLTATMSGTDPALATLKERSTTKRKTKKTEE